MVRDFGSRKPNRTYSRALTLVLQLRHCGWIRSIVTCNDNKQFDLFFLVDQLNSWINYTSNCMSLWERKEIASHQILVFEKLYTWIYLLSSELYMYVVSKWLWDTMLKLTGSCYSLGINPSYWFRLRDRLACALHLSWVSLRFGHMYLTFEPADMFFF